MSESHDRREFLRKAGLGAVAVGAWAAPQVLSTGRASAACTPVTKLLQVDKNGFAQLTSTPLVAGCAPSGWAVSRNDGVTFSFSSSAPGGPTTITITNGCTLVDARAVRYDANGSGGPGYKCVKGTVTGNSVTFPAAPPGLTGSFYVDYRITVSCCT